MKHASKYEVTRWPGEWSEKTITVTAENESGAAKKAFRSFDGYCGFLYVRSAGEPINLKSGWDMGN